MGLRGGVIVASQFLKRLLIKINKQNGKLVLVNPNCFLPYAILKNDSKIFYKYCEFI